MIFFNFSPAIFQVIIFEEKSESHIKGEFLKIRDFSLEMIFVIFTQKWQVRPEIENNEISRNSA